MISVRKVLTVGVFDLFHVGHVNLFETTKQFGGHLIVAVQDNPIKYKPNTQFYYSLQERMKIIRSLRCVDEVIEYLDVDKLVESIQFDVFAKGPDQVHAGFQRATNYCQKTV